jgi:putative ATP-binding cassette transporter
MQPSISAWQIIRPFWFSEHKKLAWGLLGLSIALDIGSVYIVVQFTYWQKHLYDALVAYDVQAIKPLMIRFSVMASLGLVCSVFSIYFKLLLEIKWRSWLTEHYIQDWLNQQHYYQLEQQHLAENPDQRIAEDLALVAERSISLFTGFLKNALNLLSYSIVLWSVSSNWRFEFWGSLFYIPGIMLWLAILYAILGSWLMEKIGRPMVQINYLQQRNEANFRYLLMRIREQAEQIALLKGEANEQRRLTASFSAIRQNWRQIMTYSKRIAFTEELYIEVGAYLPYLLILPQYFAKRMSVGDVMQTSIAFGRLRMALSWFVFNFKELAELRAILKRLTEFQSAVQMSQRPAIDRHYHSHPHISLQHLQLRRPDGQVLCSIVNSCFAVGERWLIQGRSGSGKTSLLRAIAGLWTQGSGQIGLPEQQRLLFVPQKSYFPIGSLKAALCYPQAQHEVSDQRCCDLLRQVHLADLVPLLAQSDHWEKRLSPGEQQRLAFARVVLQQPDYLFLDEATSALDPANAHHLYQLLERLLPHSCVVSIAHHSELERYHPHRLWLTAPPLAAVQDREDPP